MKPKKILIVDSNKIDRNNTRKIISEMFPHAEIQEQRAGNLVMNSIRNFSPDLILMDIYLSNMCGLNILRIIRNFNIMTPAIFITRTQSNDYNELITRIVPKNNVLGVCYKPLNRSDISAMLNSKVKA